VFRHNGTERVSLAILRWSGPAAREKQQPKRQMCVKETLAGSLHEANRCTGLRALSDR